MRVTDEWLKLYLMKVEKAILEEIPDQPKLPFELSSKFKRRMKHLIRQSRHPGRKKYFMTIAGGAAAAVALFVLVMTMTEQNAVATKELSKDITVAVVDEYAPYYYLDEAGEWSGFDIEYLTGICEYSEGSVEWISISEEEIADTLANEDIDFILTASSHVDMEQSGLEDEGVWSLSLLNCSICVWQNEKSTADVWSLEGMHALADQSAREILENNEFPEYIQERLDQLESIEYVPFDEINEYTASNSLMTHHPLEEDEVVISGGGFEYFSGSGTGIYSEIHGLYTADGEKGDYFYKYFESYFGAGEKEAIFEKYKGTEGFLDSGEFDF